MLVNYLYERSIQIADGISVRIPTLREILKNEAGYYSLISAIVASPADFMVQLDDIGIDFSTITDFELFLMLFQVIKSADAHVIFGDLDLSGFEISIDGKRNELVLRDKNTGIVVDKVIHRKIASTIREINNLTKNDKKPGNDEAKKFMISRARKRMKRALRQNRRSELESLIIALVNTEQFKYDYETVLDLTIYQFNASVNQISHKIDYEHTMTGCYAGTISAKELSQEQLTWFQFK